MVRWLLIIAMALPCVVCTENHTAAFIDAFRNTFAAKSRTDGIEMNARALQRIHSLMVREGLPTTPEEARQRTDAELLQMGMLAAVGGISQWERSDAPKVCCGWSVDRIRASLTPAIERA